MKKVLSFMMVFFLCSSVLSYGASAKKLTFSSSNEILGYQMLTVNGNNSYFNLEKKQCTSYMREMNTLKFEIWSNSKLGAVPVLSKDKKTITAKLLDMNNAVEETWVFSKDTKGNIQVVKKLLSGQDIVFKVTQFNTMKAMESFAAKTQQWQENYEADLAEKENQVALKQKAETIANAPATADNPLWGEYVSTNDVILRFYIDEKYTALTLISTGNDSFAFRIDNPKTAYLGNGVVTYTGDLVKLDTEEVIKNITVKVTTENRKTISQVEVMGDKAYYPSLANVKNYVADDNSIYFYFKLESK